MSMCNVNVVLRCVMLLVNCSDEPTERYRLIPQLSLVLASLFWFSGPQLFQFALRALIPRVYRRWTLTIPLNT